MSTGFRTSSGQVVHLGLTLGGGAEGVVQGITENISLAAKIYLPGLAAARRDKVLELVDAGWHATDPFVAYPVEALFDRSSGVFAGFTMRKVGGHKPAHELYSPTSRKTSFPNATYPVLLRAASNMARAMASVHAKGCVIGDINHSGVLVRPEDATVTLIDSDSFQVSRSGRILPCKVGVPEYTPPELQGRSLDNVIRTFNHDAFGLAVLAFYTLFMGRHPYAGRYSGPGDMPMERAIADCRFAYSSRRSTTLMAPPPNTPTLADLPIPLSDAFERAFGPAGAKGGARPTATEWISLLDAAESNLVLCSQNSAHHFFKTGPGCPWCRMEHAFPGFRAFSRVVPFGAAAGLKSLDLSQFVATLHNIPDPGPAPDLVTLMPVLPTLAPSPTALAAKASHQQHVILAFTAAAGGIALLAVVRTTSVLGLLALSGSAVAGFKAFRSYATARTTLLQARTAWDGVVTSFRQSAGNERSSKIRIDAEALLQKLRDLSSEKTKRLSELDAKRRSSQLQQHLERHTVDKMKLKGFGNIKKQTLKSYGLESAADVDPQRINTIPRFGGASIAALVAWRHSIEASFVFDPSKAANPREVAAIQSDILRRQGELEARFGQATALLERTVANAQAVRAQPGAAALASWAMLQQAEKDAGFLKDFRADALRIMVACTIAVSAIVVLTMLSSKQPANLLPPVSVEVEATRLISGPKVETVTVASPAEPRIFSASPALTPPPNKRPVMLAPRLALHDPVQSAHVPVSSEQAPTDGLTVVEQSLNPSSLNDAKRLQQRLSTLGYFRGVPNGIWGPRSHQALKEFRWAQGLGDDDQWDKDTQTALFSDGAMRSPLGR